MHGSSHHLLQKKFALVRYNAPHVQILLLLSTFRNNVIVTCNNLICDMCSPTWKTHIPSDMCSSTWKTHITRDMCSSTWETHIPSDMCSLIWETHIPSDMCSPTWETHIPSDMCSPTWEAHIPGDMCSSTRETHVPSVITLYFPQTYYRNLQQPDLLPNMHAGSKLGNSTRTIAIQIIWQPCCKTSRTFLLPVVLYSQTPLIPTLKRP